MRRMYSENQLIKIIADNVGKATSLLDDSIYLDEDEGDIYVKIDGLLKVSNWDTIFAFDDNNATLQDALNAKQDKIPVGELQAYTDTTLSINNNKATITVEEELSGYYILNLECNVNDFFASPSILNVNIYGEGACLGVDSDSRTVNSVGISKQDSTHYVLEFYNASGASVNIAGDGDYDISAIYLQKLF